MAETAQTMTEFTYAPGEKNIVGDRFSLDWQRCVGQVLRGRVPVR